MRCTTLLSVGCLVIASTARSPMVSPALPSRLASTRHSVTDRPAAFTCWWNSAEMRWLACASR